VGIEKSELKQAAAFEIGSNLDDAKEDAQRTCWRAEGAQVGIGDAKDVLSALKEKLQAAIDSGELPVPEEATSSLVLGKLIMAWLNRAESGLDVVSTKWSEGLKVARGVVGGLERAVQITKKYHDAQGEKVAALHRNGGHPPPSVKAQRNGGTLENAVPIEDTPQHE
jgi:hypothetical protein